MHLTTRCLFIAQLTFLERSFQKQVDFNSHMQRPIIPIHLSPWSITQDLRTTDLFPLRKPDATLTWDVIPPQKPTHISPRKKQWRIPWVECQRTNFPTTGFVEGDSVVGDVVDIHIQSNKHEKFRI